ncbi:MetQ/NlpA family ABC transporter substrate-binding protein [Cellulosimicrobium composti]|uniref:Methionine ABC transporter substrate-binding protein n=1 Tax=Cellulosimicrobium composti TaxID=2672572 RepID=A0ABX0BFB9_9MICO|nr:MetQ/NlpA family ABC transporter substrate-binding protein [Cellulosimicrobium composti]NDO90010.1 methionine ABC transporter substrate-binding protein [Cellulosimicrobium composti]TWG79566.1 D-methionine transport system substrate-binding protein [Cellulosimicrobium cellulans J34]SMF36648.1 D-methionine transport system substrate-binding protein [Cellulosimicrobium cellulans J1]
MSFSTTRKRLTWTAIAATAALTLTACGGGGTGGSSADGDDEGPIRIGVVGASDDKWAVFQEQAEAEGIEIELVDLQDYTQANPALSQGELDVNQFQHLQFLAGYNVDANDDLQPIGATAVYPLGLYSTKHASLEDIPEGGQVAVPNDPTNLARALLVLQDAGLVELEGGGSSISTEADVLPSSKVTVTPVDAAQTPIQLQSVDASIINNDFVADAGLKPEDALFQDDPDSDAAKPYINVWVARAEDSDDETLLKLAELSHSPEVVEAEKAASGGTAVIKENSPAELQEILAGIEDDIRNS